MAIASSWIHGNALRIESPAYNDPSGDAPGLLRLTATGRGAQVVNEGHATSSWMHMPIPTIKEDLGRLERLELLRVIILGECSGPGITMVDVYDAHDFIQHFDNFALTGNFLSRQKKNTFELSNPYPIRTGIGLSFYFQPEKCMSRRESITKT